MRKALIVLLLIVLPLDSVYAAAALYWAHHHSSGHQTHLAHRHAHAVAQHTASGAPIKVHGENGSWDCPVYHYVAGMSVALVATAFPPVLAPASHLEHPPRRSFRSVHPDVPQHRDKPQVA